MFRFCSNPRNCDVMPPTEESWQAKAGPNGIDKYMWLRKLRETQPDEYFRLMVYKTQEVMPFIYTPVVGQACQEYHSLGIQTRGLYLTLNDNNWNIYAEMR
ncbi:hypothetical protein GPECTOR_23g72 [Gonium pectorale]|uniref:Malic enzyme N-terminal domain-containing protein n=1 Tax=Gonium pectorale TaxID=33097 RepID=A0A150GH50_GONPE|nr:hypothetical protein GPECTOR_23g72 [Gonium pectorale]|eukprot:KXZ49144.1 hypothetical protein GPECTOR_23g72 [Gonium pectorale]